MISLKIERARRKMYELAERYGVSDPRVVEQSQRLDKLIVEEQKQRMSTFDVTKLSLDKQIDIFCCASFVDGSAAN